MLPLRKNEILLLHSTIIVKTERIRRISKISQKKHIILHETIFWNRQEYAPQHRYDELPQNGQIQRNS